MPSIEMEDLQPSFRVRDWQSYNLHPRVDDGEKFPNPKFLEPHDGDGHGQNLERYHSGGLSLAPNQSNSYREDIQSTGRKLLTPLDQTDQRREIRTGVDGPSSETYTPTFVPISTDQPLRPLGSHRPVPLGDESLRAVDIPNLVSYNRSFRSSGNDESSYAHAEHRRPLPAIASNDYRSFARSSSNPQSFRVIRRPEYAGDHGLSRQDHTVPAEQGMYHKQAELSNGDTRGKMRSQFKELSIGEIKSGHDDPTNNGRDVYSRKDHRQAPAKQKQVIYLGATSMRPSSLDQGMAPLNKHPQQPAPSMIQQRNSASTSGSQQRTVFHNQNPFGAAMPQQLQQAQ